MSRHITLVCLIATTAVLASLFSGALLAADKPSPLDVTDLSPPAFEVFNSEDGLSEEIWSTVGFDSNGFVWAGSASELARFDGYRWTPYPFPEARGLVRDMGSDADGGLWALFEREGLVQLKAGRWQLTELPLFYQRFSEFTGSDGQPRLALTNQQGIRRLSKGQWLLDHDRLPNEIGMPVELVRTEHLFGEPREWLGVADDRLYFRSAPANATKGPWTVYSDTTMVGVGITDLQVVGQGSDEALWVTAYGGGVLRIDGRGERLWRSATGELPTEAIYSTVVSYSASGEASIWLASRAGLLRIIGDRLTVFDRRHGLPSNAVRSIKLQTAADGRQMLWAATEGGLVRASLAPHRWQTVSLLGASENGTFGVLVEPNGKGGERLWVGSSAEGLSLLSDGRWQSFTHANGRLPGVGVRALWRVTGPDGQPWRLLSLLGGRLARIHDDLSINALTTPWHENPADFTNAALGRTWQGQRELWLGNQQSGLHRLRGNQWSSIAGTSDAEIGAINGVIEQVDGNGKSWLWVASRKGLGRIDGEQFVRVAPSDALPAEGYRSLTLLREGEQQVIWGSSGRQGVIRIDVTDPLHPKPAQSIVLPEPPDPTVYSVRNDSIGRVYVCTNNGVQQLTPLADGGYRETVFRRRDGLVHDECNSHGQLVDDNDRFWVGTLGGLSVFDPAIEPERKQALVKPLFFTDVRVDGVDLVLEDQSLQLSARTNEVRLDFTLLAGDREDESLYRTQLIGLESSPGRWSPERSRVLSNLPPGDFVLKIWGSDADGTLSGPLELALTVEPLWWQTSWARGGFALLVVLFGIAMSALYNRGLRVRARILKHRVNEQTTELQAANQRLTELSYLDPLTGLANRRRLMEAFEPAIERARAQSLPLGLIVIDVDHFKDYNDRFGHLAGDAALKAIARAIESATRQQDLVTRFGGEEFACLMLDSSPEVVERIGERMRALVEALPPRALGNDTQTITISAGLMARVPGDDESAHDLLRIADEALYAAKNAGRNRLSMA